ncbi:MAG: ATP-binding domain-containing protein, partial [Bacteroidaceae bacterium]|nr:ATP-binding domain-containing protein [Bacteroidaceae bacterium]
QILGREEEISSGDLLMVAKNNYHWLDSKDGNFIANGDVAVVKRVRNFRDMYGFHFADCELEFPDYDDLLVDATVLLDTLHSEAPALTREQQDSLFTRVLEDYADVSTKSERMKKMKEDPYFNALQVKYAYAVTCHKAQGGQWSQIFIDQGYMTEEMLGPDYFRWLYTAITRATHTVHFVNWRINQTLDAEEDE